MLCENCGERPATVHYTKIINGEKFESHLCEKCAEHKGENNADSNEFSFDQLLSGLLNFNEFAKGDEKYNSYNTEKCKNCGLTFSQFKKESKFGCSECYKYFSNNLEAIFRRIHGNSTHSGKVPLRTGEFVQLRKEIGSLKELLKQKIANEQFEEAAKIRDKIKITENKLMEDRG